jgi:hypothetical protein
VAPAQNTASGTYPAIQGESKLSDVKDEIEKQARRIDQSLQAVTVMHEKEAGHANPASTAGKCPVCNFLWRVQ